MSIRPLGSYVIVEDSGSLADAPRGRVLKAGPDAEVQEGDVIVYSQTHVMVVGHGWYAVPSHEIVAVVDEEWEGLVACGERRAAARQSEA